jgi:hypothetical protein
VHAFKLDEFDNCENLYDDLKHDHVREIILTFLAIRRNVRRWISQEGI